MRLLEELTLNNNLDLNGGAAWGVGSWRVGVHEEGGVGEVRFACCGQVLLYILHLNRTSAVCPNVQRKHTQQSASSTTRIQALHTPISSAQRQAVPAACILCESLFVCGGLLLRAYHAFVSRERCRPSAPCLHLGTINHNRFWWRSGRLHLVVHGISLIMNRTPEWSLPLVQPFSGMPSTWCCALTCCRDAASLLGSLGQDTAAVSAHQQAERAPTSHMVRHGSTAGAAHAE
jgi:hypothetical protein